MNSTRVVRRTIKRNPLKNPAVMRRLNPLAPSMKAQARATNLRRAAARKLIASSKTGAKVDAKQLSGAAAVLGIKLRKYKEYKAEKAKKAAAVKK